jgi:DNA replication protein DnaC
MKRPKRPFINEQSLILMGVPKHFCKVTLDDFKTYDGVKEVKVFVEDYIKHLPQNIEDNRGIFFCGSNGVGKSMLSCIILKEAYRRRYSCRRVTFSQYINYYTEAWNVRDKNEKDTLESDFYEQYKGVEFLVLEEIGKEIDSKIAKPILEDLLRYREEHGLVTVICSNIPMKVVEETYGPSVASLCKGHMTPVTIVGKDMRYMK